jgi:lipoate-protein ligase A
VTGSLLESYRRLSQALLDALQLLEVPARADDIYCQAAMLPANGAVCFERPSNYEITCDGKKLIGSAQARRNDGVLQHGSLPLSGDITRITQVLVFPDTEARAAAAERLLAHATTVETALGHPVSWEIAAHAFRQGFARTLDLEFQPEALRSEEIQRASELFTNKYSNPTWNSRL